MPFLVDALVIAVLFLYPTWRIFGRAGFAPAWSLLILVPGIGFLIVLYVLALATWRPQERPAAGPV